MFGPLLHCMMMRLEGKHEYFKGVFQKTKIEKTSAKPWLKNTKKASFSSFTRKIHSYRVQNSFVTLFDRSIQAILEPHLFGSSVISEAESVNVDGVRYAKGWAVLLPDLAEGDLW